MNDSLDAALDRCIKSALEVPWTDEELHWLVMTISAVRSARLDRPARNYARGGNMAKQYEGGDTDGKYIVGVPVLCVASALGLVTRWADYSFWPGFVLALLAVCVAMAVYSCVQGRKAKAGQ